jgi:hypothetical protein
MFDYLNERLGRIEFKVGLIQINSINPLDDEK